MHFLDDWDRTYQGAVTLRVIMTKYYWKAPQLLTCLNIAFPLCCFFYFLLEQRRLTVRHQGHSKMVDVLLFKLEPISSHINKNPIKYNQQRQITQSVVFCTVYISFKANLYRPRKKASKNCILIMSYEKLFKRVVQEVWERWILKTFDVSCYQWSVQPTAVSIKVCLFIFPYRTEDKTIYRGQQQGSSGTLRFI